MHMPGDQLGQPASHWVHEPQPAQEIQPEAQADAQLAQEIEPEAQEIEPEAQQAQAEVPEGAGRQTEK